MEHCLKVYCSRRAYVNDILPVTRMEYSIIFRALIGDLGAGQSAVK
jgi:hypothetical protein